MTLQLDLLKRDWCDESEAVITKEIPHDQFFTSDELHVLYGVTEPEHCNWWGVLLARMKRKKLIEHHGYVRSARPEANYRPVVLWKMI
jgi:hypothetical protein